MYSYTYKQVVFQPTVSIFKESVVLQEESYRYWVGS